MKEFAGPRGLMFKNFTDCLFNDEIILKSQQRFKSDCYNVYTWKINKLIRDYKHIYMEQTHSKYAKASFEETVDAK